MAVANRSKIVAAGEGVRPARRRRVNQEALWAYLFIAPWIVGFLLFSLFPILATLGLSFTDFTTNRPDQASFIGLDNYRLLMMDPDFWWSIWVTIRYAVIAIPVGLTTALLVATLVNSKNLMGNSIFRTLFYMPNQIPLIVSALILTGVMNTQTGWLNMAIEAVGIKGPDWLNDPRYVYPALTLIGLWGIGSTMLVYLAAMQGVPNELYDAAKVDGAGPITSFFRITLPLITPVIFYTLTLAVIGAFQYFDVPFVVSNGTGRPGKATLFYNIVLFKNAYTYFRMGYATTMAWVLFLIVMVLTIVLFATARRWVHYGSGDEQ